MAKQSSRRQLNQEGRRSSRKRKGQDGLGALPHNAHSATDEDRFRGPDKRDDRPFVPKNDKQARYAASLFHFTLTFGIGPAGTGKTYVALTRACEEFKAGNIKRMIFVRPAQDAGEKLGFTPGDLDEKVAPWVLPMRDILDAKLGRSFVEFLIKRRIIQFQPFSNMRGMSWDDAFIMLDEAQNTTPKQMLLFLSRVGERSHVVVDGDVKQQDIPGVSGLADALTRLRGRPKVNAVEFEKSDIVRSGFVRMVIDAYN